MSVSVKELRDKRDLLNARVKEFSSEFRGLIEELKTARVVVEQARKARDSENAEVKRLKSQRDEFTREARPLRRELDSIFSSVDALKSGVSGSYAGLKEALESLDWEYQTGVHSRDKENRMVKEMQALERELARHELLKDKTKSVRELQSKLKDAYWSAREAHALVEKHAIASEQHHEKMLGALKKIRELSKRLDKTRDGLSRARREADDAHAVFLESSNAEKRERKPVERVVLKAEFNASSVVVRARAEKALAAFKAGKKVSLDDLRLLKNLGLLGS